MRELLEEARRRRVTPVRLARFVRSQLRLRGRSLAQEFAGLAPDVRTFLTGRRGRLLLIVHRRRLEVPATSTYAFRDLLRQLIESEGVIAVHSRLGHRLLAGRASAALGCEPYIAAPPVRFRRTDRSAVFLGDPWDQTWLSRHLIRSQPDRILTMFLSSSRSLPGLRRIEADRWRLLPWWVPDRIVAGPGRTQPLRPELTVVGAAGPMYDLRMWLAAHPLTEDPVHVSFYAAGGAQLSERDYFDLLAARSAVVVAFSESDEMRVPVAKYVEVAAVGSLLVAARADHLDEMGFEDGVNCIMFEGRADFEAKVRPFLDDPAAYEEIAARGRDLVRERHTTSQRVAELLEMLGIE